jgi:hypothetical protein
MIGAIRRPLGVTVCGDFLGIVLMVTPPGSGSSLFLSTLFRAGCGWSARRPDEGLAQRVDQKTADLIGQRPAARIAVMRSVNVRLRKAV